MWLSLLYRWACKIATKMSEQVFVPLFAIAIASKRSVLAQSESDIMVHTAVKACVTSL